MHPIIESNREAIAALCRRHAVRRLEVFGSAVGEAFDVTRSDVDFLVDFESNGQASPFHRYFELNEELASLLGRGVDLVMVDALKNPYFIEAVNRTRQLVYESTLPQAA